METSFKSAGPDLASLTIGDYSRRGARVGQRVLLPAGLGILVVLGSLCLSLVAFKGFKPVVEVTTVPSAADPRAGVVLNASGYVTPQIRATVSSKITGQVKAVYVNEGLHVAQNQVMATLDDSDARVRWDSAKADCEATVAAIRDLRVHLGNAERELKRTKELQAAGIQTAEALDQAQTNVESINAQIDLAEEQVKASQARVEVAQQDLDNATIRAPFAGVVISKDAQVGEIVSPVSAGSGFTRTGIVTLVDMRSLEIDVDVNESYIARVYAGQPTLATLDAYPDWQIPSHVRTVIATADRQKATVEVRVSIDKLDSRILPDMGVKVAFLSKKHAASVDKNGELKALIPRSAVRQENGSSIVFVVRDGRIERRAVTLAEAQSSEAEVLAGLVSGEIIVVNGPETLHDGQAVEIKP